MAQQESPLTKVLREEPFNMLLPYVFQFFWLTSVPRMKINLFSVDSQFLMIMSLAFKYMYEVPIFRDQSDLQSGIPALCDETCGGHGLKWFKIFYFSFMAIVFFVSIFCAIYSDDEFDGYWVAGGVIGSYLLAVDHIGIHLTARDWWMFGSHLDTIAWIPQYKSILKKPPDDGRSHLVACILLCMFPVDAYTVLGKGYDYDRHELYGNIGYRLVVLKSLFYWVFVVRFLQHSTPASKSEAAQTNDEIYSISYIVGEDNVLINKHGLMSPN